jgi:hypothetical protein
MKQKNLILMIWLSICFPLAVFAQEAKEDKDTLKYGWTNSLIANLTLSQVSYTNWAAGGDNALAYNLLIDGKSVNEKAKTNWATNYIFAYGQARLGSVGLRKTDDRIDLASVLAYKMSEHYDPYGSVTFKSQFTTGYSYDASGNQKSVSGFLDPAIATEAVGFLYHHAESFRSRLGVALRETFTNKYNIYTDDPGTPQIEKSKIEGGLESVTEAVLQLEDNILFKSKLELFAPFKTLDVISVYWDNLLALKVSKYIVTNLGVQIINNRVVTPKTQIKEALAIGLTYALF